jgi:hypothetical protein
MPTWTVEKFVRANGNCPIDKWKQKDLTKKDRIRLGARIEAIERMEELPPNIIEKYKGNRAIRVKAEGG